MSEIILLMIALVILLSESTEQLYSKSMTDGMNKFQIRSYMRSQFHLSMFHVLVSMLITSTATSAFVKLFFATCYSYTFLCVQFLSLLLDMSSFSSSSILFIAEESLSANGSTSGVSVFLWPDPLLSVHYFI